MSGNATLGTRGPRTGSPRIGPDPQGANLSCRSLEGHLGVLGGQRRPPGPHGRDRHAPPRAASSSWLVGGPMSGPCRPVCCLSVSGRGPREGCPLGYEAHDAPPPVRSSRTRTGSGRQRDRETRAEGDFILKGLA